MSKSKSKSKSNPSPIPMARNNEIAQLIKMIEKIQTKMEESDKKMEMMGYFAPKPH